MAETNVVDLPTYQQPTLDADVFPRVAPGKVKVSFTGTVEVPIEVLRTWVEDSGERGVEPGLEVSASVLGYIATRANGWSKDGEMYDYNTQVKVKVTDLGNLIVGSGRHTELD